MTNQEIETFVTEAKAFSAFEDLRDNNLIDTPDSWVEQIAEYDDGTPDTGWCDFCQDYHDSVCEGGF